MEALGRMLDKAVLGGFIHGFELGRDRGSVVTVSHFLFADDTLVFCNAKIDHRLSSVGFANFPSGIGVKDQHSEERDYASCCG